MKKNYLIQCFITFFLISNSFSQSVNELSLDWGMVHNGINSPMVDSYVDPLGFSYVVGKSLGTANFNPLGAAVNFTNPTSATSVYIAKYNPSGVLLWKNQLYVSGSSTTLFGDLFLRVSNNKLFVLINYTGGVGNFNATSLSTPGAVLFTGNGSNKLCSTVSSFSLNGVHLNTNKWTTTGSEFSIGNGTIDIYNNLWIVGKYVVNPLSNIDLNPSGAVDLVSNATAFLLPGVYAMKLSNSDAYLFSNKYDGLDCPDGRSLGVSPKTDGGVLFIGSFLNGGYDIDLGPGVNDIYNSGSDMASGKLFSVSLDEFGGYMYSNYYDIGLFDGSGSYFKIKKSENNKHVILINKFVGDCSIDGNIYSPAPFESRKMFLVLSDAGLYLTHHYVPAFGASFDFSMNKNFLFLKLHNPANPSFYSIGTNIIKYDINNFSLFHISSSLSSAYTPVLSEQGFGFHIIGDTAKNMYINSNLGNISQVGFTNNPSSVSSFGGGSHGSILKYNMCYQSSDTVFLNKSYCRLSSSVIEDSVISLGNDWFWVHPNGSSSNDSTINVSNFQSADFGIYTVFVRGNNCFWKVYSLNVQESSIPVLSSSVSYDSPACVGSNVILHSEPNSNWSYSWSGPNGFSSNSQNPIVLNAQINTSGIYHLIVTDNTTGCSSVTNDSSYVDVIVNPSPIANITSVTDTSVCRSNQSWGFTSDYFPNCSYDWRTVSPFPNPNDNQSSLQNPTFNNAAYTWPLWTLQLHDTVTGCYSLRDSIYISILSNPSGEGVDGVTHIFNNASNAFNRFCEHDSVSMFIVPGLSNDDNWIYSWTGPNGFTSTDMPLTISDYDFQDTLSNGLQYAYNQPHYLTFTDTVTGCFTSTEGVVRIVPEPIYKRTSFDDNLNICYGNEYVLEIELRDTIEIGIVQVNMLNWSGPNGFSSSNAYNVINPFTASNDGVYVITLTDSVTGCSRTIVDSIFGIAPPVLNLMIDSMIVCDSDQYTFSPTSSGEFHWSDGSVGSSFTAVNSGWISLYAVSFEGCQSLFDSVFVDLDNSSNSIDLIIPSNYCIADEVSFIASGGGSYSWTGPNGFESTDSVNTIPYLYPSNLGSYDLLVTYPNGCTLSAALELSINDFFCSKIPQIITNNNDQLNDNWTLNFLLSYPENKVMLFNRWGDQVFELSPYHNEFNGVPNMGIGIGKGSLPNATYYYIIDLDGKGENVLKGYVELQNK